MKRPLGFACLALYLCVAMPAWAAEDRLIVLWSCEMKEGATVEKVRELGNRLMAYAKKAEPDYRGYAMTTIMGDRTRLLLVDSYPNVSGWEKIREAFQKPEGLAIDAEYPELMTCTDTSMHNLIEYE